MADIATVIGIPDQSVPAYRERVRQPYPRTDAELMPDLHGPVRADVPDFRQPGKPYAATGRSYNVLRSIIVVGFNGVLRYIARRPDPRDDVAAILGKPQVIVSPKGQEGGKIAVLQTNRSCIFKVVVIFS